MMAGNCAKDLKVSCHSYARVCACVNLKPLKNSMKRERYKARLGKRSSKAKTDHEGCKSSYSKIATSIMSTVTELGECDLCIYRDKQQQS